MTIVLKSAIGGSSGSVGVPLPIDRDFRIFLGKLSGIQPLVPNLPANIEVTLREADGRKLLFLLNAEMQQQN
ncbi:hypothetical protein C8J35_11455 [Rhizobium sp. PP-F2F-G38]|nr:hypothetical protein C8J37_11551 [Rhizobium sp. PP-WC-1G-195]PYE39505.1 hypothetical protein DFI02_12511 [Rhizobium sp. PP-F2F-G20b]PYE93333.1 hypothetical protein C8J35_11455 [Rhizobium sp. PP-F2F-G38]TCP75610.1 hypothetical protein C8J31_13111 [Rhizobium sp. PP-CC-2G-626]TCQ02540.1 hypothetical protein C8J34_11711 [Rhizobium sp. PP-F2F-G36]TCQ17242.1 hypothetical protein C8J33_11339 [Rhizobium sp. PP-CC-3G-465]